MYFKLYAWVIHKKSALISKLLYHMLIIGLLPSLTWTSLEQVQLEMLYRAETGDCLKKML